LPIELVECKPAAQVKPSETRFGVGMQASKWGQKSGRVDTARTVDPMDHVACRKGLCDPMFGDGTHASTGMARAGQVIHQPWLRTNIGQVEFGGRSPQQRMRWSSGFADLHVNH